MAVAEVEERVPANIRAEQIPSSGKLCATSNS
jgi:hypothetical protein